jgi:ABC-type Co2+ transport system permease subunit
MRPTLRRRDAVWHDGFARVRRLLSVRIVPLLAVASAFIMMFNIPLPRWHDGHAVGVGSVTVVLASDLQWRS